MSAERTFENLKATGLPAGSVENGLADVIDLEVVRDTHALTTFHGQVAVKGAADNVSWTAAVPDELQHDSWGLIVPGYGAFKRTSRHFRNSLARNEGIMTVSYDPARRDESFGIQTFLDPQQLHTRTIDAVVNAVRRHEALGNLPGSDTLAEAPVTLVAHSMGGLAATEWALNHPDEISMLVYLGAAGLNKASALRLISRTPKVLLDDVAAGIVRGEYGYSPVLARRAAAYFARNPKRTLAEMVSCFTTDNRPELHALGSLGVRTAVMCMEKDAFFKPDETFEAVGHLVDETVTIPGTHTAPQRRPREVASAVASVIRRAP